MKYNKGILYGVGIGPGDSDLLTLKAINIIKKTKIICLPRSARKSESIAHTIISPYLTSDHILIDLPYSMSLNSNTRMDVWKEHAKQVHDLCSLHESVVFCTLGDPCIYSTFIYLVRELYQITPEISIDIIPGISSINAGTALMGKSLAQWEQSFCVIPCAKLFACYNNIKHLFDTIVVMKIGNKIEAFISYIKEHSLIDNTILIAKAGMGDQQKIISGNEIILKGKEIGYLTTAYIFNMRCSE